MNEGVVLPIALIGGAVWLLLGLIHERPGLLATWNKYVRPQVRFVVTKHFEDGFFEIVGKYRVLRSIVVNMDGYWENSGGTPTTVTGMKSQLRKRIGPFEWGVGREIAAAYGEPGSDELASVSDEGYYIGAFRRTRRNLATGSCGLPGRFDIKKLDASYSIRLTWIAMGQPAADTRICPSWDTFRKGIAYRLSQPIPDTEANQL